MEDRDESALALTELGVSCMVTRKGRAGAKALLWGRLVCLRSREEGDGEEEGEGGREGGMGKGREREGEEEGEGEKGKGERQEVWLLPS